MKRRDQPDESPLPNPPSDRPRGRHYIRRPLDADGLSCSGIERRAIELVSAGHEPGRAGVMAGYAPASAHVKVTALLRSPRGRRYKAEVEAESVRRQRIDIDEYVRLNYQVATLRITDVAEYWTPPCRHCWGANHEHQRDHAEMEQDLRRYEATPASEVRNGVRCQTKPPFDPMGGDGYDLRTPPNPDCPNCRGEGDVRNKVGPILKDFDRMPLAAQVAITGFKRRADGSVELSTDKTAAGNFLRDLIRDMVEPGGSEDGDGPERVLRIRPNRRSEPPRRISAIEVVVVRPPTIDAEAEDAR